MMQRSFGQLTRVLLVGVLAISGTAFFGHTTGYAEVVEVEGQADCPGGNDGWQRHLIVDIASKRTFVRCVRVEQVVVTPTPSPSPSPTPTGGSEAPPAPAPAPAPAPVTVSRVVGSDPYPSLPTGGEIPGTRTWSTSETSWAQFATNSMASGWSCPAIYGPNGDPYAAENNGFDNAAGKWFRVCVKNPWREPISPQAQANYEKLKSDAQVAALALSTQWNKENPGLQKCFQWGPFTSPSGGIESGGVCANAVGSATQNGSESTTATSVDSLTATASKVSDTGTAISPAQSESITTNSRIPEPIDFKGSIQQIAETLSDLEISELESSAILSTTSRLSRIKATSKLVKIVLPNSSELIETARSLTPSVCKVTGLVVQPKKAGTCQISYTVEGESGNSFETTKKVTFKK